MATDNKPWIDLSYYGLRLHLVRSSHDRVFLLAIGQTASNAEALDALGFEEHPRAPYWFRAFAASERLELSSIRSAFPDAQAVRRSVSEILLNVTQPAPTAQQSEASELTRHISGEQPTELGRLVARLLAEAGIRTRVQELATEAGGVWRGALRSKGLADVVVEIATADGGLVIGIATTRPVADGRVARVGEVRLEVDGAGHLILRDVGRRVDQRWVRSTDGEEALAFVRPVVESGIGRGQWVGSSSPSAPEQARAARAAPMAVGAVLEGVTPDGDVGVTVEVVSLDTDASGGMRVGVLARVGSREYTIGSIAVAPGGDVLDAVADAVEDDAGLEALSWKAASAPAGETPSGEDNGAVAASADEADAGDSVVVEDEETSENEETHDGDATNGLGRTGGDPAGRSGGSDTVGPDVLRGSDGDGLRPSDGRGTGPSGTGGEPAESGATGDSESRHRSRDRARQRAAAADSSDRLLDSTKAGVGENYRLIDGGDLIRSRFNPEDAVARNLSALRALRRIEANTGDAEDRDALIRYVGWGGLSSTFVPGNRHGEALRDLVTQDEFDAARSSTLNAHFTAVPVVDAIWSAVRQAGFTGGRVLEPGAGVGLFMARVPDAVSDAARFVAVEKDSISSRILRALYPRARVFPQGYEVTPIPDDSVDLVIGNVPFGNYEVYDPRYRKLKAPIHDYFICKSLDKLRAGGVMAVITSTGTLDKQNTRFRAAMYESSDLLAAIRMPNNTFEGNAGTQVTTDLLVFRKRYPEEAARPFDWEGGMVVRGVDGSQCRINQVFATDRGKILGELVKTRNLYGAEREEVRARPGSGPNATPPVETWGEVFAQLIPAGSWAPRSGVDGSPDTEHESPDVFAERAFPDDMEGSFIEQDGRIGEVVSGQFQPLAMSRADEARIRALIPLRDATKECLRWQLAGGDYSEDRIAALQASMRDLYAAFTAAHGPINRSVNRRAFSSDPDVELVCALEVFDPDTQTATPAAIFSERTLGVQVRVERCETPDDALFVCLNECGRVVPERIAELAEREWDDVREALRGKIFRDPESGEFEIAAKYLSGNIRRRLDVATAAAEADEVFAENVTALTERLPRPVTAEELDVSLGVPWIGPEVIEGFLRHLYERPDMIVTVRHNPYTADWRVEISKHLTAPQWGTTRVPTAQLVELSLRGQAARVWDTTVNADGSEVRKLNEMQTAIALERQKTIQDEFRTWVFADPDRRGNLVDHYNKTFNAYRSADYSSLPMSVPGMTMSRTLRPIQGSAVARIVMERNVLLAHPVGFGKTATMAAAAMKLRALGQSQKIIQVVPKNVISQFGGEIKRWFPAARVLSVRSADLNPKGRKAFWRKVQVSNPDVILVTPEAFKRIALPREAEVAFINEEIGQLEAAIAFETAGEDGKPSQSATRAIKRIEKMKQTLTTKLERLLNAEEKDDGRVTFAQLGISDLFCDEAHRYKNLQVVTRERVLGVPTAASQRAFDMASKVRYIQQSGGRVVMATGSPITNTLAEAFTLQRYLMRDELDALRIGHFDAWKAQFANLVYSLEPDPGGSGYRTVARLAEVRNVPELVAMLGQITDAVSDDAKHVGGRPEPTFTTVSVEPNEPQRLLRETLGERVREMRRDWKGAMERGDNILVVLGDSRRASLDLRTLYPELPADEGGDKLPTVAKTIVRIYNEHTATRSTQAVFLDFGTPPTKGAARKVQGSLNAYEDLTRRLVELGIPREEIAWIHDAKTDEAKGELFRRVRSGDIRVMIGSTEKMGEGSNMQDRMVALHHLNAPAHPGHVTQRNGRAIRQGNLHKDVGIYTYVTKGLLEDWAWHLVLLKDKFIRQVIDGLAAHRDGEGLARRIVEDGVASMDFGAIEAEASDNPLVKEKAKVDAGVNRLEMLRLAHGQQRGRMRQDVDSCGWKIDRFAKYVATTQALIAVTEAWKQSSGATELAEARANALARLQDGTDDDLLGAGRETGGKKSLAKRKAEIEDTHFVLRVGDQPVLGRTPAGEALMAAIESARAQPWRTVHEMGSYQGLQIVVKTGRGLHAPSVTLVDPATREASEELEVPRTGAGLVARIERAVAELPGECRKLEQVVVSEEDKRARLLPLLEAGFPQAAELDALKRQQSEINIKLAEANEQAKQDDEGLSASERLEIYLEGCGVRAQQRSGWDFDEFDASVERGPEASDEDEDESDEAAPETPSLASAHRRRSAEADSDDDIEAGRRDVGMAACR